MVTNNLLLRNKLSVAIALAWVAIALACFAPTATFAGDCNELLRLGYADITQTISEYDSLVAASKEFCSQEYRLAGQSKQRSIGLAFEVLKVKIGGSGGFGNSNIEETQKSFCDLQTNNSEYRSYTSSYSLQINDRAVQAWERCNMLDSRGLRTDIRPTPDFTAVTLDIYWGGSTATRFQGIDQPDLGKATCMATGAPVPKGTPPGPIEVTPATDFALNAKTVTFSCVRQFQTVKGKRFTDRMRLTFKTRDGSFDVELPALELRQVSTAAMNDIHNRIADLDGKSVIVAQQTESNRKAISDIATGKVPISCGIYLGHADLNGHAPQAEVFMELKAGAASQPLQLRGKVDENDRLFLRYECRT